MIWSEDGLHIWSEAARGWVRPSQETAELAEPDRERRTDPITAAYLNTTALQVFSARINCHTGNSDFRTAGKWVKCWGGINCLMAAERARRTGFKNKGSVDGPTFMDMKGAPWCAMCWEDALQRHSAIRDEQRKRRGSWVVTDEEKNWWGPACFVCYWKTQLVGASMLLVGASKPGGLPMEARSSGKGKPAPKRLALEQGSPASPRAGRGPPVPGQEGYKPPSWKPGMKYWWEGGMVGFITPEGEPEAIPLPELKAAIVAAEETYPKDNATRIWFQRITHMPGQDMSISRQCLNKAKTAWGWLDPGARQEIGWRAPMPPGSPPRLAVKDAPEADWGEEEEEEEEWEEWEDSGPHYKKTRRGQGHKRQHAGGSWGR